MALPRKKSRSISVDGQNYRWLLSVNTNAPFHRTLTIAVELAHSPGTKLIVSPIGVDVSYVDYNRDEPITPKVIEKFIRDAIEAGWAPADSSGTFVLGDRD